MGRLRQAPSAVDLGDGLTPRDVPMDTLSSYVTAFGAKPTGESQSQAPEVNPMGQYRTNRSQTEWTLAHGDDEGVAHTTSGSMPLHAFHTGERAAVTRLNGGRRTASEVTLTHEGEEGWESTPQNLTKWTAPGDDGVRNNTRCLWDRNKSTIGSSLVDATCHESHNGGTFQWSHGADGRGIGAGVSNTSNAGTYHGRHPPPPAVPTPDLLAPVYVTGVRGESPGMTDDVTSGDGSSTSRSTFGAPTRNAYVPRVDTAGLRTKSRVPLSHA